MNHPAEVSPKNTYRVMAAAALILIGVLSVAIYNLSKLNSGTWVISALTEPNLSEVSPIQDLPSFQFPHSFGGHWTLLTFWAYWCGPCLEEMPALNSLSQQWQGPDFQIITVNVDTPDSESFESARTFLTENAIVLPTHYDKSGEVKKAFAVTELPRHFLINPEKKIVWQARGAFKWNDIKTRDQLIKIMETAAVSKEPLTRDSNPESVE